MHGSEAAAAGVAAGLAALFRSSSAFLRASAAISSSAWLILAWHWGSSSGLRRTKSRSSAKRGGPYVAIFILPMPSICASWEGAKGSASAILRADEAIEQTHELGGRAAHRATHRGTPAQAGAALHTHGGGGLHFRVCRGVRGHFFAVVSWKIWYGFWPGLSCERRNCLSSCEGYERAATGWGAHQQRGGLTSAAVRARMGRWQGRAQARGVGEVRMHRRLRWPAEHTSSRSST